MELFADPRFLRVYHRDSVAFIQSEARHYRVKHTVEQVANHHGEPYDITLDCDEDTYLKIKDAFNNRRK